MPTKKPIPTLTLDDVRKRMPRDDLATLAERVGAGVARRLRDGTTDPTWLEETRSLLRVIDTALVAHVAR